jgi:hypothetical protein
MNNNTAQSLDSVFSSLKLFLQEERKAYQNATGNARYSKQARHDRRTSHRILSYLVPRYRMLDKLLHQRNISSYYKAAPQVLAAHLIQCFIGKTRISDTHAVWQLKLTAEQLRGLVETGPVSANIWLARWEGEFPGITQTVLHSQAVNLRELRTDFLSRGAHEAVLQQEALVSVLDRVRAMLPRADYQVLVANLRTPVSHQ